MTAPRDFSTAVPDWEERIRQRKSLVPDLPLFAESAEKAIDIFVRLRAPDIIGQPTLGSISEDWVIDFVRAVFGLYDPEKQRRMIQEFFLMVPKKNYKSGIASGIMLTALILNERPNAELVLVSETQKISGIAFSNIKGMIQIDEVLSALFHIVDHKKKVIHMDTEAELQIVSADGDVVTGSKASFVLVDEAHVLGAKAKAPGVYLELRGGLAARPEGFFLQITTQSKKAPSGQYKKELNRARAVRDGKSKARLLPILYEFPADMLENEAWQKQENWPLVNPNYGLSVDELYLEGEFDKAKEDGRDALALFASQHLNVEIGGTGFGDGWSAQRYWAQSADQSLTLETLLQRSEVVTIGIDGGGDDDLCGFYVIGRDRETRRWLGWGYAWVQPEVLEIRKKIAAELLDFEEDGDLTVCREDGLQHVKEVVQLCAQIVETGLLPETDAIGVDEAGLPELNDELKENGFEELCCSVPQGWRLTPAVKSIPMRLKSDRMRHADQPLMDWCVGNAKSTVRSNNEAITKEVAGSAKIDPVIAMINAAMLMFNNPQAKPMIDYDAYLANPVKVA